MWSEKIVESSRTAAFSSAIDGSITAWNRGAANLFQAQKSSVVGQKCYEVIAGRDVFGNDYCCAECASWRMASSDRPVRPYRLEVTVKGGRQIDLRVSVLATSGPSGRELVHILESLAGGGVSSGVTEELDCGNGRGSARHTLTCRELQVLRHLAQGYSTKETAQRLEISTTTVRNHISRCLQKLETHSRLEAVAVGRRLDLV
jgi:DNA-binding CsgD family transcriptional regulator